MTDLKEALSVLATVHTQDNEETGYVVSMNGVPMGQIMDRGFTVDQYLEAWGVVRRELELTHEMTLKR